MTTFDFAWKPQGETSTDNAPLSHQSTEERYDQAVAALWAQGIDFTIQPQVLYANDVTTKTLGLKEDEEFVFSHIGHWNDIDLEICSAVWENGTLSIVSEQMPFCDCFTEECECEMEQVTLPLKMLTLFSSSLSAGQAAFVAFKNAGFDVSWAGTSATNIYVTL